MVAVLSYVHLGAHNHFFGCLDKWVSSSFSIASSLPLCLFFLVVKNGLSLSQIRKQQMQVLPILFLELQQSPWKNEMEKII